MNVVVSAVLIIAFSILVVGLVLQFAVPLIQEHKQELEFQHGKDIVNFLSITTSNLISEPINSSRKIEIEFKRGILKFSNNVISISTVTQNYNKTFDKIQFNEIEVQPGKTKVELIKTGKNEVKVLLY